MANISTLFEIGAEAVLITQPSVLGRLGDKHVYILPDTGVTVYLGGPDVTVENGYPISDTDVIKEYSSVDNFYLVADVEGETTVSVNVIQTGAVLPEEED